MLLQVENINKSFNKDKILKGVSFSLNKGEVLTFIGESGAGKTTLLRCLNYLEKCDGGSITIDDKILCKNIDKRSFYSSKKDINSLRKSIGLVFQNFNLFPHMTVLENIMEAPVKAHGIPKSDAQKKALELLSKMSLLDKKDAYPFELSGGQRQRVAIARACALGPKILCFDEPTSALDPGTRESVISIIEELSKDGFAIIIVTHDLTFAKKVSNKVIYMDVGQIIEEGTTAEIFENPKNHKLIKFLS